MSSYHAILTGLAFKNCHDNRANFKINFLKEFVIQQSEFRMIANGIRSMCYVAVKFQAPNT